jgi:NTE family protein
MADGAWNTIDGVTFHEADAVFEGGGVKGLGLAYAMKTFEEYGYTTWRSVAGTSAGSIMAAYIACGGTADGAIRLLETTPWAEFQDWGHTHGVVDLLRFHALCLGDHFHGWMGDVLRDLLKKDATFGDVLDDTAEGGPASRLQMIATDITRKKMLVLPYDLEDFADEDGRPLDWKTFKIADAVRMSMAIPYFFVPVYMHTPTLTKDGKQAPASTGDDAVKPGTKCTIVDGGVLSNFPVWLFDTDPDKDPHRPTFGFYITGGKGFGSGLDHVLAVAGWPLKEALDIFHTTSGAWDKRFHSKSTVVRTCPVPVDGLGTTDFDKVDEYKDRVRKSATKAAVDFVEHFKLSDYRNTNGKHITIAAATDVVGVSG